MTTDTTEPARWMWWHRRAPYECVRCGFRTRRYDSIDIAMNRPVHPRMSVAMPGYNTLSTRLETP